ncbi:MAG: HD domain-containing protein [Thermodesulfobacteriota bacterium]|nr:MAG: HD domain-containing protein [Thermodesulfobacteriota bacterium]
MNPLEIIAELYEPGTKLYQILVRHGEQVANKAIDVAIRVPHLKPNLNFIKEAAMLHDVGIIETNTPEFGCSGKHPYVCHGYLGKKILEKKGLPEHALVCERHVGIGITVEEIKLHHLPLPQRDMVPISIEEQIICFADKFFSKNGEPDDSEKSVEDILNTLRRYGPEKVIRFQKWVRLFENY